MKAKRKQLERLERAWYRAKARAEQAIDQVSDYERKMARLREEIRRAGVSERRSSQPSGQNAEKSRKKGGGLGPQERLEISITEREHATILAALRLWQQDAAHVADGDGSILAIAEEAGDALSNGEVDALCERVNFHSNRGA
jgi:hypothetical protein